MLQSTHRPAAAQVEAAPLPSGWTEHKAPTGHTYYYNAETKQSTYTRPVTSPEPAELLIDYGATQPDPFTQASFKAMEEFHRNSTQAPHFTGGKTYQDRSRRENRQGDRPKTKKTIPNCEPWVLVKTKYGRRFVHNTETRESLWKFPSEVMMAVIDMDRIEWEENKKKEEAESTSKSKTAEAAAQNPSTGANNVPLQPREALPSDYDSDEYEEVEVTDDEDPTAPAQPSKRPRTQSPAAGPNPDPGPVEFDEDDIAYQLAAMDQESDGYDYPDDEASDPDVDATMANDDDVGLPLTAEDQTSLFRTLLDDHEINPFSPFDTLLDNSPSSLALITSDRWTSLPNMASRRAAFDAWSRDRIAERNAVSQQRAAEAREKPDPRTTYLAFLSQHASTKLYYPEYKRKFRSSPQQNDRDFAERDREKTYREYSALLKKSEDERKREFTKLVKPGLGSDVEITREMVETGAGLPKKIGNDVRFWGVRGAERRWELVQELKN